MGAAKQPPAEDIAPEAESLMVLGAAVVAATRRRGWSEEDSEVTEGFASVAVRLNSPSNLAAVAVTWQSPLELEVELVLDRLRAAAATIEARLR